MLVRGLRLLLPADAGDVSMRRYLFEFYSRSTITDPLPKSTRQASDSFSCLRFITGQPIALRSQICVAVRWI